MTLIDHVEHVLGILSLATMVGLSGSVFRDAYGQRHRIMHVLCGAHLHPATKAANTLSLDQADYEDARVEAVGRVGARA